MRDSGAAPIAKHRRSAELPTSLGGLHNVFLGVVLAIALTTCFFVFGIYWLDFGQHDRSPSLSDWGAFGDYVGGLLNPTIALVALLVLAYGVYMQRRGLSAYLNEVRETVEAQRGLVELQALTVYSSMVAGRAQSLRGEAREIAERMHASTSGPTRKRYADEVGDKMQLVRDCELKLQSIEGQLKLRLETMDIVI